jgi:hypothetical protein
MKASMNTQMAIVGGNIRDNIPTKTRAGIVIYHITQNASLKKANITLKHTARTGMKMLANTMTMKSRNIAPNIDNIVCILR